MKTKEISSSSNTIIEEYICNHEPFILRNGISHWDLIPDAEPKSEILLDKLNSLIGHRIVPVSVGIPSDQGLITHDDIVEGKSIPNTFSGNRRFSSIVDQIKLECESPTQYYIYLQSMRVDKLLPELSPYLDLQLIDRPEVVSGHWNFWLGTGQHHVNIHYDRYENFFCVIAGTKRFTLFPVEVLPDIYSGPLEGGPYGTPASLVDPLNIDFDKFPRFSSALEKSQIAELNAGDVLYLPANWWHHVESIGFNASANYWWTDIYDDYHKEANATFLRALLSIRSLPKHWRTFWKVFFDHYVTQTTGDPYMHLEIEHQGYAGKLTEQRKIFIQNLLEDHDRVLKSENLNIDTMKNNMYQLSANSVFRIEANENITIHDLRKGLHMELPCTIFPAIHIFYSPSTPFDAYEKIEQSEISEIEFYKYIHNMVVCDILIEINSKD